jgi:hypothetical protein
VILILTTQDRQKDLEGRKHVILSTAKDDMADLVREGSSSRPYGVQKPTQDDVPSSMFYAWQ